MYSVSSKFNFQVGCWNAWFSEGFMLLVDLMLKFLLQIKFVYSIVSKNGTFLVVEFHKTEVTINFNIYITPFPWVWHRAIGG